MTLHGRLLIAFEFELNLNLLTTHHNNDSTYEQSYNANIILIHVYIT